jgi:hypothetical protein
MEGRLLLFSPRSPVAPPYKTDHHDITAILLKVALNNHVSFIDLYMYCIYSSLQPTNFILIIYIILYVVLK